MSRIVAVRRSLLLVALVSLTGCRAVDDLFCNGAGCEWTEEEWTRVQALSNASDPGGRGLPELPDDPSNMYLGIQDSALRERLTELGRMFYFDPRFSGVATLTDSIGRAVPYARAAKGTGIGISCADCHNPTRAGADFTSAPNTVSIGAGWYDVNGQQTVNAAFFADYAGFASSTGRSSLYWNGRTDSVWAQAAQVNESGFSMNGDRANTFWVILMDPRYLQAYNDIFQPDPLWNPADFSADRIPRHARPDKFNGTLNTAWACMQPDDKTLVTRAQVNFGKAIEAYERTLLGGNSAFDRFIREGKSSNAISPSAKRGARLFVGKASCVDCHNGNLLSDGSFHNIGVPQTGDHVPTVEDCRQAQTKDRCDCTLGAEAATCAPAGAWSGLKKLSDGVAATMASPFSSANFTRNSKWSDSPSSAGYYCGPTDPSLKGAWRTPSLRDVAITAPYMHDGFYQTLEEVVWHYNVGGTASGSDLFIDPAAPQGEGADAGALDPNCPPAAPLGRAAQIKPLGLTDGEMTDIVEFLKTLTSQPLEPPDAGFEAGAAPDVGGAPICFSDGGTFPDGSSQDGDSQDGGSQ